VQIITAFRMKRIVVAYHETRFFQSCHRTTLQSAV
jgi:hypothetical protein